MPNISSITHYPLKVIFAVHLFFVTWGLQGYLFPVSMMFYNLLFFLCLLWAIHNLESDEPIQFALFINVLSIFFDIITLSMHFPDSSAWVKFCAAMMIINLIIRVLSSYSLLQIGQARGGTLSTMFASNPAMGFGRQEYEDMSQPVPNNADFA
ncbi:uncharacterized protein LOC107224009 isoform X1 [Neodiprion lecontei]|uniref:Uncharacterized protein LOC107224009 isoform X1 n=1 Tax=Neodiprion lecontei TaxID=441921 RepID=A0A6J0BYI2_NEOLC|nr:uncharacterized protein LOC107224009 isoform X1 [Neodiprion lecontei]